MYNDVLCVSDRTAIFDSADLRLKKKKIKFQILNLGNFCDPVVPQLITFSVISSTEEKKKKKKKRGGELNKRGK